MAPTIDTPGRIGPLELRGRAVFPAMLMNFASDRGEVTERLVQFYRRRAAGGYALIITECVFPQYKGGIATRGLALYDDRFIPGFVRLAEAVHAEGARFGVQIFFDGAGRVFASDETVSIGPSDLTPWNGPYMRPMTVEEIETMADDFAAAGARAVAAGADAIEIHMGHGHLLGRYLSPHFNRREDEFGGSLDARLRFPGMVIDRLRTAVGSVPLLARLSLSERIPGGTELAEAIEVGRKLREKGIDAIHTSVGTGTTPEGLASIFPTSFAAEAPFAPWATEFRSKAQVTTIFAGKVSLPETAARLLETEAVDFVSAGRAGLSDPDWPKRAARGEAVVPCIGCNQGCSDSLVSRKEITSLVNPKVGFELDFASAPPLSPDDRFVVLGGGLAGLVCAIGLSERGADVALHEASGRLGGQFHHCRKVPGKEQYGRYLDYLIERIDKSDIRVLLNATEREAARAKAAMLIWAGGSLPRPWDGGDLTVPIVPGADCFDTELGNDRSRITVIGAGQTGMDAAIWLADAGHAVTLCDASPDPVAAFATRRHDYRVALERAGVTCLWGRKAVGGRGSAVRLVDEAGTSEEQIESDIVVAAVGRTVRPRPACAAGAIGIGDATKAGTALDAVRQATFHACFTFSSRVRAEA